MKYTASTHNGLMLVLGTMSVCVCNRYISYKALKDGWGNKIIFCLRNFHKKLTHLCEQACYVL